MVPESKKTPRINRLNEQNSARQQLLIGQFDQSLELRREKMLDNLRAEDPSERVVFGRLEIVDSVVLDYWETLRTAKIDHIGVHVDTDCLVAGRKKQLQHLTSSAPDVDDLPATRGGRKEGEIAFLGELDILA